MIQRIIAEESAKDFLQRLMAVGSADSKALEANGYKRDTRFAHLEVYRKPAYLKSFGPYDSKHPNLPYESYAYWIESGKWLVTVSFPAVSTHPDSVGSYSYQRRVPVGELGPVLKQVDELRTNPPPLDDDGFQERINTIRFT